MLDEIRAGNVATVIIKDQSRIGRDVVEVGLLKRTFDEYHVRFIAAVVRRIFQSVLAGETIASIAKALRAEKIPIPSEHWKRAGEPVRAAKYADPYAWSATTIGYILKRPEYMGRKVLGKTVCENYKTKSSRKTAPEEQYTFEGAIPAIVDVKTWQTVQKIRETVRRAPKRQNAPNRLTGLLYCADCGSKLTHRYNLVQGKWVEDAFICSGYRHLIHDCTMHHIPTVKIEAAILAVIQRVSWLPGFLPSMTRNRPGWKRP